jgi:hypothetical protein
VLSKESGHGEHGRWLLREIPSQEHQSYLCPCAFGVLIGLLGRWSASSSLSWVVLSCHESLDYHLHCLGSTIHYA